MTLLPSSSRRVLESLQTTAGNRLELASTTYFRAQQQQRRQLPILFRYPRYRNWMLFSAEASGHKVPGVKVNKQSPPSHTPSSPLTPSLMFNWKTRNLFHGIPDLRDPDTCRQINTHTNKQKHPSVISIWAYRGVLLLVPACDETVLSLHLLHPLFTDLLENRTKTGWRQRKATVFDKVTAIQLSNAKQKKCISCWLITQCGVDQVNIQK